MPWADPRDVQIEILYCGICHSDLHQAHNDWSNSLYPMVPGHEAKERNSEQLTFGGYSEQIVVDEHFVVNVPANVDLKGVAPLLCAGITTYSPLRHWKVGPGQKVGVIGLGGLGHMGVKFAKALGAHVVMITTSPEKGRDAQRLGADEVLLSRDAAAMAKHARSFDFLAETQEMIDFCAQHGIVSDVEMVPIQSVNAAYERLVKNDVKYRFVIDMSSLKQVAA